MTPPSDAPTPEDDGLLEDEQTIHDNPLPFVEALIAEMDAFCEGLPLTAHLSVFRNPYSDVPLPIVVLTDLFAEVPGQGAGSRYIAQLTQRCDEMEISIYVDADGPRSRDFYLARGFETYQGPHRSQLVRWPPLPAGFFPMD